MSERRRHRTFSPFGNDRFGRIAEKFARLFGTPQFIIGQTVLVVIWIGLNVVAVSLRWDPYPFILLNLAFSTQAAYAAPLILLAQTRQADRDKIAAAEFEAHRDEVATKQLAYERRVSDVIESSRAMNEKHAAVLEQNHALIEQIAVLTRDLHAQLCADPEPGQPPA